MSALVAEPELMTPLTSTKLTGEVTRVEVTVTGEREPK